MVLFGISYLVKVPELACRAIVFSDSLNKDLSHGKLVEDPLFRQMINDLNVLASCENC